MTLNRPHPIVVYAALAAAAFALLVWGVGCSAPKTERTAPAKTITTSETVRAQSTKIKTVEPKLVRMRELITGLTNENVVETKRELEQIVGKPDPKLPTGLFLDYSQVLEGNENIGKSVARDVEHTRKVEDENNSLREPERAEIRGWGVWCVVGGCFLLALYFASGFIPVVGPWIQKGGNWVLIIGGLLNMAGFMLITLSRFIRTIELICLYTVIGVLGLGLAYAIAWAILNWREALRRLGLAEKIVTSIEKKQVGGVVNLADVEQPPDVMAFVDSVQKTISPAAKPVTDARDAGAS
jgi:hypothetical protein